MYLLVVGGAGPGQNYVSETFITLGSRTRGDDGGQLTLFSLCCSPFGAPETPYYICRSHTSRAHLRLRDHKGNCEHTIFLIERPTRRPHTYHRRWWDVSHCIVSSYVVVSTTMNGINLHLTVRRVKKIMSVSIMTYVVTILCPIYRWHFLRVCLIW